jgi:hypothetical protein
MSMDSLTKDRLKLSKLRRWGKPIGSMSNTSCDGEWAESLMQQLEQWLVGSDVASI